jgi:integrase
LNVWQPKLNQEWIAPLPHIVIQSLRIERQREQTKQLKSVMQPILAILSYINVVARNGAAHPKKVVRPLFPNLTTYWARHTWATIAADLDIPDAVIDAALGHRSPYRMSEIYIKRNAKKVDAAIRKVIDYVNSNDVVD